MLTHRELVAQWKGRGDEPSECGHCGEVEIKAVWEGVAVCTKCVRKTPGTKEGFEFEGLLLLSQVVADVWGERAMRLRLTTKGAWLAWQKTAQGLGMLKGMVSEEVISKRWHAALCSMLGDVSMSVAEWVWGWAGLGQQVKVLMLKYWGGGPVFQRGFTTVVLRGVLVRWGAGEKKHGVGPGDWETDELAGGMGERGQERDISGCGT